MGKKQNQKKKKKRPPLSKQGADGKGEETRNMRMRGKCRLWKRLKYHKDKLGQRTENRHGEVMFKLFKFY